MCRLRHRPGVGHTAAARGYRFKRRARSAQLGRVAARLGVQAREMHTGLIGNTRVGIPGYENFQPTPPVEGIAAVERCTCVLKQPARLAFDVARSRSVRCCWPSQMTDVRIARLRHGNASEYRKCQAEDGQAMTRQKQRGPQATKIARHLPTSRKFNTTPPLVLTRTIRPIFVCCSATCEISTVRCVGSGAGAAAVQDGLRTPVLRPA